MLSRREAHDEIAYSGGGSRSRVYPGSIPAAGIDGVSFVRQNGRMSSIPWTYKWVDSPAEQERMRLAREAIERIRKMTPEERFQSMVRSGIYTPAGELRVEYGGTGRDEHTDEGYCTTPVR